MQCRLWLIFAALTSAFAVDECGTSEEVCNAGYTCYQSVAGSFESFFCKKCEKTTYKTLTGNATCIVCPKGFVCSSKGLTTPTPCNAGRYETATGLGAADDEPECKACTPGRRSTGTTQYPGATSCTDCLPGFAGSGNSHICSTCSASSGSYQPEKTKTSCLKCANGERRVTTAADGTTLLPNTASKEQVCIPCETGRFQPTRTQKSHDCNGKTCTTTTYSREAGQENKVKSTWSRSTCYKCPEGRYQNGTSKTSCKSCAKGKFHSSSGKTSVDACTSAGCTQGYWCDNDRGFLYGNCGGTPCSQDGTSTTLHKSKKVPCPTSRYGPSTGLSDAAQCTKCSAGKWQFSTHSAYDGPHLTSDGQCTKCTKGLWSSSTGKGSKCTSKCAGGKWGAGSGMSAAVDCVGECSAGKWSNIEGFYEDNQCVACDAATVAGRYATATGQSSEAKACTGVGCSAGRYGNATGKSTESDACNNECAEGKYGAVTGKTSESKACGGACGAGKFGTGNGKTSEAKACALFTTSPTLAPTSSPTIAPTSAPTSALANCFTTMPTIKPITIPEYLGVRLDSIVVNASTAAACFSGTASTAVTIVCETNQPLRTSVTPRSVQIKKSDINPLATFALDASADASNDGPSVPFSVSCSVEETPGKGTITFNGNVQAVRQPSIEGFCLDYVEGHCAKLGPAGIIASISSSGLNNVTLHAAHALTGSTFNATTRIFINGMECEVIHIGSDGRTLMFVTPPLGGVSTTVREGYNAITITNDAYGDAGAGTLCWGAACIHDRCNSASGSLCPALPLAQRGIFFTSVCVGSNRLGEQYSPPTSPLCVSVVGDEAAQHCSWGRGGTCRVCPFGCRCPGGSRCWVLPGFWVPSIDSTVPPIACEPEAAAALRCLGYNTQTGVNECGQNHDGFMCEGCKAGYFPTLGDCKRCPSTELIVAVIVPLMWNCSIAGFTFALLLAVTFIAMRADTWQQQLRGIPTVQNSCADMLKEAALSAIQITVHTVKTLQLVALSLQGCMNPLPSFFAQFIRSVGVVLLNLPEVHLQCVGNAGAFASDVSIMVVHSVLAVFYILLSFRFVGTARCRRCGIARAAPSAADATGLDTVMAKLVDNSAEWTRHVYAEALTTIDFGLIVRSETTDTEELSTADVDDDIGETTTAAKIRSRARAVLHVLATKVHPYVMVGTSYLLSMIDPILVSRAHRVLHCIKTPIGWRLKENADVVCFDDDHTKAMWYTFASLAIGGVAFVWTIVLPYCLFFCRAPAGGEARAQAEVEGDAEEAAAGKVRAALFQVGLDPQTWLHRCKCSRRAPQVRVRNVQLHMQSIDDVDGTRIAFGNLLDADVQPHAFWFAPLQCAVSALLGLIVGLFGGTHAAGIERSKVAQFFASAFSIVLLIAFATLAVIVRPFRQRARDSWKIYGLVGSVIVASLSEALAFALSLRTGTESDAYGDFCTLFGGLVVLCCVMLFTLLGIAYLVAMNVPLICCELVKYLYSITVVPLVAECSNRCRRCRSERSMAKEKKTEHGAVELGTFGNTVRGDVLSRHSVTAVEQLNPMHCDPNISAVGEESSDCNEETPVQIVINPQHRAAESKSMLPPTLSYVGRNGREL